MMLYENEQPLAKSYTTMQYAYLTTAHNILSLLDELTTKRFITQHRCNEPKLIFLQNKSDKLDEILMRQK